MDNSQETSTADGHDTATPTASPLGPRLKLAREGRGLSIDDVARNLRLEVRIIEALERDDFEQLPAMTFVKGYLRNYARLVGLDEASLLQDLPQLTATPAEALQRRRVPGRMGNSRPLLPIGRWLKWLAVMALLAAVVVVGYPFVTQLLDRIDEPRVAEMDTRLGLPVPDSTGIERDAAGIDETPVEAPLPVPQVDTQAETVEQTVLGPVAAAPVAEPEPPEPALPPRTTLVLEFEQDSWVDVRDARERLLFGTVRQGERKELSGTAPYSILLGNAPGVRVEFEGEVFDTTPFRRGKVARFKVE